MNTAQHLLQLQFRIPAFPGFWNLTEIKHIRMRIGLLCWITEMNAFETVDEVRVRNQQMSLMKENCFSLTEGTGIGSLSGMIRKANV